MPTAYHYIEDDARLAELADLLFGAPDLPLSCDTETTGLDPLAEDARLLLLQIALPDDVPGLEEEGLTLEPGVVFVVNACKCDLSIIKPALEDGRLLVFQNAKFDLKWLRVHADIKPRRVYDTMIAELMLEAGIHDVLSHRRRQASLKVLAKKYLKVEMEKGTRRDFVGWKGIDFTPEMLQYAADDVPMLFDIMRDQAEALNAAGLYEVAKVEFEAVPTVAKMELNGMGVHADKYRAITEKAREAMDAAEWEVKDILKANGSPCDLFGDVTVKITSGPQLIREFKRLGVEVLGTDETVLSRLSHEMRGTPAAAVADALLKFREYQKLVSTYGDKMMDAIHPITGRIHPEYQQLGSDAGRFSCDSPNIQQIPAKREYRECFVPARGNVLVVGDWSQFELRIACAFSHDQAMLDAFVAGRDLHSDTAARMYGLDYEDIDKHHPARQDAKILNFALCYGMGPTSLAVSLKCEVKDAKDKIKRYFTAYPQLGSYLAAAAKSAVTLGETRTLMGRRRLMPPPMGTGKEYRAALAAMERKGKNTPIQGSNADFLKETMVEVERRLLAAGIGAAIGEGIIACVHDEIVLEVPAALAEEAKAILVECMTTIPKPWMGAVPVKADVGIVPCWLK